MEEARTTYLKTWKRWWARHIVDEHDTSLVSTTQDTSFTDSTDAYLQYKRTKMSRFSLIKQYCTCGCVISIHQPILIHTNVFSDDGDKWNSNEYSTSTDKFIPVTWLPKYLTQNQSYEYKTKATKACNKQQVKCKELLELLFLLSLTGHIPSVV